MRRPLGIGLGVAVTAILYIAAMVWVRSRYPLPPLDARGVVLLGAAVACEGAGKWEIGRLYRRSLARMGETVSGGEAFRASLVGSAVARLIPMGGALTPAAMAWTVGKTGPAVKAGIHVTTLSYGVLLLVAGAGTAWAGSVRAGGLGLLGIGTAACTAGTVLVVASRRLSRLVGMVPARWRPAAERYLPHLPADPRSTGLAFLRVGYEAAALLLTLAAFRLGAGAGEAITAFGVSQVASGVPGLPGGVGVAEAGLVGALAIFGYAAPAVLGPALVFRVVSYWLPALAGLLAGATTFIRSPETVPAES